MSDHGPLFLDNELAGEITEDLRRFNPWWENRPMPAQPKTRRHVVAEIRRRVEAELAPIVVVRGLRQIGKTTAQLHLIQDLLDEGVPPTSILRVQFDELQSLGTIGDPIIAVSQWFERHVAGARFNRLASDSGKAYLFFDEVGNLDRCGAQLKSLVDHASVKVIVTGSSTLWTERGRDSLAGRTHTLEAGFCR